MFPIKTPAQRKVSQSLESKVQRVTQHSQAISIYKVPNGPTLFLPGGPGGTQLQLHLLSGL